MPGQEIEFCELESMPDYQRLSLAQLAISITERCFEKPGMEEKFQEWLPGYLEAQRRKGGMQYG